jgi:uncharacterized caspase-like protein
MGWLSPGVGAHERRLTLAGAAGERRLAYVVGNDAYAGAPLRNAVADARTMAATLREVGFEVLEATNVDLVALERGVDQFVARLQPGDVALFFYAGHGVQIEGENYLSPVDFRGGDEVDLKYRGYSATRVHEKLAKARVRVIVLDACRDNPFRTTRSGRGGLAELSARGSLIAFATGPGSTASDNPNAANGLFTSRLAEALKEPGLTATEVFRRVRAEVNEASGGRQFPWVSDGLIGDFVFRTTSGAAPRLHRLRRCPNRRSPCRRS